MKPQSSTLAKKVVRKWHQIDVSAKPLGRASTEIANLLRGKHKRDFTPHVDMGDYVVAINAGNLKFTGRKVAQKVYYHHSGYLGGIKETALKDLILKDPEDVLKRAVFSMIDDIKFRKKIMSRLKIVKDSKHDYKIDKIK
jgi:large subunit ribosomal protein L13